MSATVKPTTVESAFEEIVSQLPPLVTPKMFEEKFDVPVNTQNDWRSKGRGPKFLKVGRTVYYPREDVLAWLKSRVFSSTAEARKAAAR